MTGVLLSTGYWVTQQIAEKITQESSIKKMLNSKKNQEISDLTEFDIRNTPESNNPEESKQEKIIKSLTPKNLLEANHNKNKKSKIEVNQLFPKQLSQIEVDYNEKHHNQNLDKNPPEITKKASERVISIKKQQSKEENESIFTKLFRTLPKP